MRRTAAVRPTLRWWPWWAVLSLASAPASVAWWLLDLRPNRGYDDHAVGPYAIPLVVEYAVGVAAAAVACARSAALTMHPVTVPTPVANGMVPAAGYPLAGSGRRLQQVE